MNVLILLAFTGLAIGFVLVVVGTMRKNRWGVNIEPLACPQCGQSLARVRVPRSLKQSLWGGLTCDKCGVEVDKWGRMLKP